MVSLVYPEACLELCRKGSRREPCARYVIVLRQSPSTWSFESLRTSGFVASDYDIGIILTSSYRNESIKLFLERTSYT